MNSGANLNGPLHLCGVHPTVPSILYPAVHQRPTQFYLLLLEFGMRRYAFISQIEKSVKQMAGEMG